MCDPRIGVAVGEARVCTGFCDTLLQSCSDEFFALDAHTHNLTPCRERDTVCVRLREWAATGSEVCLLSGYTPVDADGAFCFAGSEPANVQQERANKRSGSSRTFTRSKCATPSTSLMSSLSHIPATGRKLRVTSW